MLERFERVEDNTKSVCKNKERIERTKRNFNKSEKWIITAEAS